MKITEIKDIDNTTLSQFLLYCEDDTKISTL